MKRILLLIFFISATLNLLADNNCSFDKIGSFKHPRLLLPDSQEKEMMDNIKKNPLWFMMYRRTIKACDKLLAKEPLEKELIGIRMLGTSREALYRIFMLSFAYRTTHDVRYAKRAELELLSLSAFDDWNPTHFLDVAEMTMAVSIGYDWLYNYLSEHSRVIIMDAIYEKGLLPSMNGKYNGFLEKTNNWNQVCNAAMAYGAMAIFEKNDTLCKNIIRRAVSGIQLPMKNYSPMGVYPEGYGYWHYGTTYNVMLIAQLRSFFGDDFGLVRSDGFLKTAEYIQNMVGPTFQSFNYGDSGSSIRLNTSLFWFAKMTGDFSLIANDVKLLREKKDYEYDEYWRMLPSVFIFGSDIDISNLPSAKENVFVGEGPVPVCLMRSSWNSDAVYVGIKGGSPSDNTHTHMDEGSFVMDADSVRWAIDLGSQDYNSIETLGFNLWDITQNSDRWKVARYNNLRHNVFSMDDGKFNVNGRALLKSYKVSDESKEVIFDVTSLYTHLDAAYRSVILTKENSVIINDRIENGEISHELIWRMLTKAEVRHTKDGFILSQQGKRLKVSLPVNAKYFSESALPMGIVDATNPGVSVIGYRMKIDPKEKVDLKVFLIPIK